MLPTRRWFLKVTPLVTGGLVLGRSLLGEALAQSGEPRFLVMAQFSGGWDQLLTLDPRDATLPQYRYVAGRTPTTGIYPGYSEMAAEDPLIAAVMTATGGRGVQQAGALTFGPAVPASLLAHAADLSIIRGIAMDTVTHLVGARYMLTGRFPRGITATGSSLDSAATAQLGQSGDLPNLGVGNVESYNEGLPAFASAVRVARASDVSAVLKAQGPLLRASSDQALAAYEAAPAGCAAERFEAPLVAAFADSRAQARRMTASTAHTFFRFTNPAPTPELAALYAAFGIDPARDLSNSPKARAALVAQALTQSVTQVAAVELAVRTLDDHFDMPGNHSQSLTPGLDALGRLIAWLKSKTVPGHSKTFWECTTLFAFSEFSRTPLFNAKLGRDHHVTGSCLVAGPGLRGGRVFGASSESGMQVQRCDPLTGVPSPSGVLVRPADIHATLLRSMGLSAQGLAQASPMLLSGLLESP